MKQDFETAESILKQALETSQGDQEIMNELASLKKERIEIKATNFTFSVFRIELRYLTTSIT